ncbi:amidohydrolase family protein [bacterium]|nr:amidohydrolase family protein [bacterium]
MKVIDLAVGFPESKEKIAKTIKQVFFNQDDKGLSNYKRIFGPKWAASLGMTIEEIEAGASRMAPEELEKLVDSLAGQMSKGPDELIAQMDSAGIEWGLVNGHDNNEKVAELITAWPGRFKGVAAADPHTGEKAVEKLERAVSDLGFIAYYASPFDWGIRADDPRFYPLYAKATALDVPVIIYSTMNYRLDRPMDIGRPLYLDRVAMDFPDLRIVAECGGWPWVPELIGVARRHRNIYINTCSHRPKHLTTPGSGWEMLMQFGNTLLQDRIVFASGADDLGLSLKQIVDEMEALPLKDSVKEKWLYKNALTLFKLD